MRKFKKGDLVEVISGRDKGKQGKIESVQPNSHKVVVEKVNIVKKHVKPSDNDKGGIIEVSLPIDWSNVKLVAPGSKKLTRVGFVVTDKGKQRVAKVTGNTLK